jgi:hypothetical protein
LHCLGFLYCFAWLILIISDIELLRPVINNEVNRVGTDQQAANESRLLNPTTVTFERETKLRIRLVAEEAWSKMQCDDIGAKFMTQESKPDGGISLPCVD